MATYKIEPGDNLSTIAAKLDISLAELKQANPAILPPDYTQHLMLTVRSKTTAQIKITMPQHKTQKQIAPTMPPKQTSIQKQASPPNAPTRKNG